MTRVLTDYRTRVLNILGHATVTRFDNDILDEGLRAALQSYSFAIPNILSGEVTVATSGRTLALSSLTGLTNVLEVGYPYTTGEITPKSVTDWYFFIVSGAPALGFNGATVPEAGRKLYLRYTAHHTIDDLDGASTTTIPAQHDTMFVEGAAGYCALMRASQVGESYRTDDYARMYQWGSEKLAALRASLTLLRNSPFTPMPQAAWPQDEHDRGDRY